MTTLSADSPINALLHSSWTSVPGQGATLTYSFLQSSPADATADDRSGFVPMNTTQQQAAQAALNAWAAVANLHFVQVGTGGQIEIGTNNQGTVSSGYAYQPDSSGDPVYLYTNNYKALYNFNFDAGSYGNVVMMHELGHTLGLKHPGNYNAGGGGESGPFLPEATDNIDYTLMSYHVPDHDTSHGALYPVGLMMYDIAAAQYLYGANTSYHTGNDTYSFNDFTLPQCIWDAGGTNTLDFSACTGPTVINLNPGEFSSVGLNKPNVSIAYGVTIQNAWAGDGGSSIYCNGAGDRVNGGAGNDYIYQGAGDDVIAGGGGGDTVVFDGIYANYQVRATGSNVVVSGLNSGHDQLYNIQFLRFSDQTIAVSSLPVSDAYAAGPGDERFIGGPAIDTVRYSDVRADFKVAAVAGGFLVTDLHGNGGTDTVQDVDRLLFSDGAVALDVNAAAGQTYRLYQAAFDRVPDPGGVGFWLNQLDKGTSLLRVAQYFVDSPEFNKTYGALDNSHFVTQMYANVLHRAPDAGGLQFYLDAMDHGVSRAQVLQGFAESPENQAALIGAITNGIDFIPLLA
jgi:hypothetical protein